MNVLPRPGLETRRISPPSSRDSSRLMARPSPVPPYLRLVLPSACWNASKMICCLSGEMPMPVSDTRRPAPPRPGSGPRSRDSSRPCAGSTVKRHLAVVRELEGVGQQVLDDLLQPLGVGEDRLGQLRIEADEEVDVLRLGHVPEGALDVAVQVVQAQLAASTTTVPDSILDRSRMSLMSISRSLPDEWIVLANSVCLAGEVALGVLAELVGEDEQAVERRAQLVRHVGEELGLVLGGEGELLGLFLERLAGLLDFLVLAFDLLVLVGQQARPFPAVPRWCFAVLPAGSAAPGPATATA